MKIEMQHPIPKNLLIEICNIHDIGIILLEYLPMGLNSTPSVDAIYIEKVGNGNVLQKHYSQCI